MSQRKPITCFLQPRHKSPHAVVRLFCFPHAGGAPSAFFGWPEALSPEVEVVWVQQPGRGGRFSEEPYTSVQDTADEIAAGLTTYADAPLAFYGHSLGAVIAFEVARKLRLAGSRIPCHLFVGAARAPHLERIQPSLQNLSNEAFIDAVHARYSGIPTAVSDEPELMQLFLPLLRADFTAYETYTCTEERPLSCPITAFTGSEDPIVKLDAVQQWSSHTNARFTTHVLPGDHFFLNTSRALLTKKIREALLISDLNHSHRSSKSPQLEKAGT